MSETSAPAAATATADVGFHDGELAVQQQGGHAGRGGAPVRRCSTPPSCAAGSSRSSPTARSRSSPRRDAGGRLWTSPLSGPPGFLEAADPTTLAIHAQAAGRRPAARAARRAEGRPGDRRVRGAPPRPRQRDAHRGGRRHPRRRGRAGATATARSTSTSACLAPAGPEARSQPRPAATATSGATTVLSPADAGLIRAADTFFLGTTNPERGSDTSHRGGTPGFVRVDGGRLWWPDYPGNNLFNSFGNLAVDPEAALLFLDFDTGRTLHLSGTAEVEWDAARQAGRRRADRPARRLHAAAARGRAACYRRVRSAAPPVPAQARAHRLKGPPPMTESRPPFPPFDLAGALKKVQAAEDAWNTRDPERGVPRLHAGLGLAQPRHPRRRPRADRRVPHRASGSASSTTRCARTCGASATTASPSASSTSPTTTRASGGAATATSCGSSRPTA